MSELKNDILRNRRSYFIDKVKAPLMKAISILGNRYPEPTKENIENPNALALLDICDKFLSLENNPNRIQLFKAFRRILISEYEHDNYYAQRIDWFLGELVKAYQDGHWIPAQPWSPMMGWKDPAVDEARIQAIQDQVEMRFQELRKR